MNALEGGIRALRITDGAVDGAQATKGEIVEAKEAKVWRRVELHHGGAGQRQILVMIRENCNGVDERLELGPCPIQSPLYPARARLLPEPDLTVVEPYVESKPGLIRVRPNNGPARIPRTSSLDKSNGP